jgi:dipeptidyl aminopeptidase/acylaminoacyl peptidase
MRNKPWHIMFGFTLLLVSLTIACTMQEPQQNQATTEQPIQKHAAFEVRPLSVSPMPVIVGNTVVITTNIYNSGDAAGLYKAILSVDGQVVDSRDVTLTPGQTSTVKFSVNDLAVGKHGIAIGESTTTIDVLPKPAKIAFLRYLKMYTMDSDGNNVTHIADNCWWPTWSPDGTQIAYESSGHLVDRSIYVMDADGKNAKCITPINKNCQFPAWSPDGKKIAYCQVRPSFQTGKYVLEDIYIMNSDGTDITEVTSAAGSSASNVCPKWFPDSKRIAFVSNTAGFWEIYSKNIDGPETIRYAVPTNALSGHFPAGQFPLLEVSPDGTQIAFEYAQLDRLDICVFNINTRQTRNLTKGFGETNCYPTWSPDGTRIAFTSGQDIFVMDTDGGNITLLVEDAYFPAWQRR